MSSADKQELEGFDRVFPLIGGNNHYQYLLLLIVSFQKVCVFHHIGYIFLGASPAHWCAVEELANATTLYGWSTEQIRNLSIPTGAECEYYDLDYAGILRRSGGRYEGAQALAETEGAGVGLKECRAWIYDDSVFSSTTVTQFDLVCHRKHLVATIQATYMVGIFVGSLLLGAVSDKILGRRRTSLLCFAVMIVFGFATAWAPSYWLFVLCRFIIGIGVAGSSKNCYMIRKYKRIQILPPNSSFPLRV
jgi:hypothetical protein